MKKLIILIILMFVYTLTMYSQYKPKTNLNIDDKSGNLIYNYQLQKRTMAGHFISVNLTYASNVMMTSFEGCISSDDNTGWNQIKRTQPAWIVGVNGFAVQVLGQKFIFNSSYRAGYKPHYYDIQLDPLGGYLGVKVDHYGHTNEATSIWAIDGYDFCNRLKPLSNQLDGDVIKLLRSDGTILELNNPIQRKDVPDGTSPSLYTGTYFESGFNTSGYAIVEFVEYSELNPLEKEQYDRSGNPNARRPRIVRYFPGDGLEYTFREDTNPYGTRILRTQSLDSFEPDFHDVKEGEIYNSNQVAELIAKWSKHKDNAADFFPTIFYLDAVSTAEKELIDAEWVGENELKEGKVFRGRRPLQKVADVAIHNSFISELTDKQIVKHSEDNYDQSFYTIETLDKTIYLNYDSKYNLQDRGGYQVVSSESIPSFYLFNNFDKWIEEDEHGNQIYTHNNAALNYFNLFHSN